MAEVCLFKLLCLLSCCSLCVCHNTVPDRLWPLAEEVNTKEKEVCVGDQTVRFSDNHQYLISLPTKDKPPGLQYTASDISDNSLNVTLGDEIRCKFMVMALFRWDVENPAKFFRYYDDDDPSYKFSVFAQNKNFVIEGPDTSQRSTEPCEHCPTDKKHHWYTIAIKWDSKMEVYVIQADTGDSDYKGKTLLKLSLEKSLFYGANIPHPGTLQVGPVGTGGGVCCLRVYEESFDHGHIEKQMWEDCQHSPHWWEDSPNPCGRKPCQNGGNCRMDITAPSNYTCTCRRWYTGENCTVARPLARQGFKNMGTADLAGKLEPMTGGSDIAVRSLTECTQLCLRENMCMSFTYTDSIKRCTLYDDFIQEFSQDGSTMYFIEST